MSTATKRAPKVAAGTDVTWTLTGSAAAELCAHLRTVASAAAPADYGRPVLTALRIRCEEKRLRITATDSYRLYEVDRRPADGMHPVEVVIPARLAAMLPRRVGFSETLTITFGERITVEFDGDTHSVPGVAHKYPDSDSITGDAAEGNDESEVKAFNPKFLTDIYRAAKAFADHEPVRVVHLVPMKPCRFEVIDGSSRLTMILMPVRTT